MITNLALILYFLQLFLICGLSIIYAVRTPKDEMQKSPPLITKVLYYGGIIYLIALPAGGFVGGIIYLATIFSP